MTMAFPDKTIVPVRYSNLEMEPSLSKNKQSYYEMKINMKAFNLKGSIESVENLNTGYAGIMVGESLIKMTAEATRRCR